MMSADTNLDFRQKRLVITLAGGGFLWEARALIEGLGDGYEYHFVTTPDSISGIEEWEKKGKIHVVTRVTSRTDNSLWRTLRCLASSFLDSLRIIRVVNPSAIICIGSSISIPFCFWAKLCGKKSIFIESITRVSTASRTGKIISIFGLSDRFYVQWPEATALYRNAIYRGDIL